MFAAAVSSVGHCVHENYFHFELKKNMLQCFRNVNQREPRADSESTWPQFVIVHHSAAVVSSTGHNGALCCVI